VTKMILALDQGTTSSRAILFNQDGQIVANAQQEFTQYYPRPGWVEHDASEIWASQMEVAAEVMAKADLSPADVAAIGITNQRETVVLWDRATGEPVHNAIVWQDRRTAKDIDRLKEDGLEPLFQEKTGLVLDAYFSASKLRWLLEHVDGARARAEAGELAFGTVDSWLLYKLTGGEVHATDITNASRTLLMNLQSQEWDSELLEILDIPKTLLPEIRRSSEVYGEAAASAFGVTARVAGIAGDQQAATFGQACFAKGQGKNTYGTGAFMVMNTGHEPVPSTHKLLSTVAWQTADELTYALEGSVFIAGAVVQWLRDGLGMIKDSADIEALAASVESADGVILVPAFAGLGAPHWDQYARGSLVGITRGTTRAHIARAALEGIAFQVADVVRAMEADSGIHLTELRVDGGASVNNLLMQFQADILGVPVVRPTITETTALGAAYLAGLAVSYWPSQEVIATQWREDTRFEPQISDSERDRLITRWQEALERAKGWATS
jgi:glycerol kinase